MKLLPTLPTPYVVCIKCLVLFEIINLLFRKLNLPCFLNNTSISTLLILNIVPILLQIISSSLKNIFNSNIFSFLYIFRSLSECFLIYWIVSVVKLYKNIEIRFFWINNFFKWSVISNASVVSILYGNLCKQYYKNGCRGYHVPSWCHYREIIHNDYLEKKGWMISEDYSALVLDRLKQQIKKKINFFVIRKCCLIHAMHGFTSVQFRWRKLSNWSSTFAVSS